WGRLAARTLDGTLEIARAWRPDLIIAEPTEYAGQMAASLLGVAWVEHSWGLAVQPEYRPAAEAELAPERALLGLAQLPPPALVFTAMARGVPPLALPQTAAHVASAERMAGTAAGLQRLPAERDPDSVVAACRELLTDQTFAKCAETVAQENAAGPVPSDVVT